MTKPTFTLTAARVHFFSDMDEKLFYAWLGHLTCVESYHGVDDTLFIHVRKASLDNEQISALMALFKRYDITVKELGVFAQPKDTAWQGNGQSKWFRSALPVKETRASHYQEDRRAA